MKMLPRITRPLQIILGLLLVAFSLWLLLTPIERIKSIRTELQQVIYDLSLDALSSSQSLKNSPIVIVNIDEKSLSDYGRWPWPRELLAQLVSQIHEAGAVVLALDMIFPEKETNIVDQITHRLPPNATSLHQQLKILKPDYDGDAQLGKALKRSSAVLGIIFHNYEDAPKGLLPAPPLRLAEKDLSALTLLNMRSYTSNIAELQQNAGSNGFLSILPDSDGVIRRTPLILRYQDGVYYSLGFEAALLYLLQDTIHLDMHPIGNTLALESISLNGKKIPTDETGQVLIPFYGHSKTFTYISASDVLNKKIAKNTLKNKIVFLASSSLGLTDTRATPVDPVFPGVEIHATIAQAVIDGHFLFTPPWAQGAEISLLLLLGIIGSFLFPFLGPWVMALLAFTLPSVLLIVNLFLMSRFGLVLAIVVPILEIILLSMMNLAYDFIFESRSRRALKQMFSQYVPPAHVEAMAKNPEDYSMQGESREMSVLFSDIRNFTTLAETLSAEAVRDLLNRFFTPMTQIIFEHAGTIDKYVGDMIMAFWGAPLSDPKHAVHAIETGLAMQRFARQHKEASSIQIGVGINTGFMNVGDMGSAFRRSYTVIGDAVNLGSRLESLTKFYHVDILVSETTKTQAPDFVYRHIDKVKVKGKKIAINIYEPLLLRTEASPELLDELRQYHQALDAYFAQEWVLAEKQFLALQQNYPDTFLYEMFAKRTRLLREHPPEKWHGFFEHQRK